MFTGKLVSKWKFRRNVPLAHPSARNFLIVCFWIESIFFHVDFSQPALFLKKSVALPNLRHFFRSQLQSRTHSTVDELKRGKDDGMEQSQLTKLMRLKQADGLDGLIFATTKNPWLGVGVVVGKLFFPSGRCVFGGKLFLW